MIQQLPSAATMTLDVNVEHRVEGVPAVFTITPTVSGTINAIPDGLPNQFYVLIVRTTGTTSYTLTFGSNIKSTGTLATGTVDAKTFTVTFLSTGSSLIEIARTAAQ